MESLAWLFSLERLGMKFGLENMTVLMAELGEPHRRFPAVLVAGTNGKGSVTAMVDTALRAADFSSARYTSPHLVRLEERFVVNGDEVSTPVLEAALTRVRRAVEALLARGALAAPATFFECATAAAFDLFASASVDIAVLEVGLGGRLDATNVVTPLVAAITTIDFDHQAQLGSTIEAIAFEKAGIIKPGVPVVVGRLPPLADDVVARVARDMDAPLIRAHDVAALPRGVQPILAGAHQRDNAIVAIALVSVLREAGFAVGDDALRQALEGVRWPGRLELLRYGRTDVLLDAAHNPAGARALAAHLSQADWADAILVFGAMADKDARGMLAELVPVTAGIICTTAPTPRAESAETLAAIASSLDGTAVETIADPRTALERACARSRRVVVAGSMFLIGPLRGILR
ncbi:MAG: bifunctional folylpolyglutamate synthase/dihydrofolate synthase [Acidobacteria bacterium]|nr:bifunctional folylpolyglutamate synthase/dihydrofolate synthase [Acidobacteriota bacterium]